MFIQLPPPLSVEDRLRRCHWWPIYIPRIYLALRRQESPPRRRRAWKLARQAFHAWAWGFALLPWE
jgi:hypothetical protein